MFMPTSVGMVRATTRAPRRSASADASSWSRDRSGTAESTVSTFQLIGRWPRRLMSIMRSISRVGRSR